MPLRLANSSVSVCAEAAAEHTDRTASSERMGFVGFSVDMGGSRHQRQRPTPNEALREQRCNGDRNSDTGSRLGGAREERGAEMRRRVPGQAAVQYSKSQDDGRSVTLRGVSRLILYERWR